MNNLPLDQLLSHDIANKIDPLALGLGHQLAISPFLGKKKKIKLNHTKYEFKSIYQAQSCDRDQYYELATTAEDHFHVEFFLIHPNEDLKNDEKAHFFLRTLNGRPFRINGVYCYECWPQLGDYVDLGPNRLYFHKESLTSSQMENELNHLGQNLLQSNLSILIEGETGSGKTHLAKKIHQCSMRQGQFVHLNISAFAPTLLESELFGHVKGAFTGAHQNKTGALELAHKGTLFLDEIDSLSWEMQTKLLLFLDNKRLRPVGATIEKEIDVRIITASGKKLEKLVDLKAMRADFYYRLNSGASIFLTPLRESPKKMKQILQEYQERYHLTIDQKLFRFYAQYDWPGNIRQLLGHLDKKRVLSKMARLEFDEQDQNLISHKIPHDFNSHQIFYSLEEIKRQYVKKVFQYCQGHVVNSAKILDISPATVKVMIRP